MFNLSFFLLSLEIIASFLVIYVFIVIVVIILLLILYIILQDSDIFIFKTTLCWRFLVNYFTFYNILLSVSRLKSAFAEESMKRITGYFSATAPIEKGWIIRN